MIIIGCDFHSRFQQIAMLETETGEITERRLSHENEEARAFYAALARGARIGMEATGYARWFEWLLRELGHELWVGDAAQIRAAMVRKQKNDPRDALHILELLSSNRFPRIWSSSPQERDLWHLLRHRDKLVRWQTKLRNQLQALAMGEGLCRKKKLWSDAGRQQLEALELGLWGNRRRKELLQMLDQVGPAISELDQAVEQQGRQRPAAVLLRQQAGVGAVTSLAFALAVGPIERFANSKKLVSYLGLNPSEHSSGGRQQFGAISKQGNTLLRYLLVQAAQTASRKDPELRRDYQRLVFRRGRQVAKVAIARKVAVRLYWKLRKAGAPSASDSQAG